YEPGDQLTIDAIRAAGKDYGEWLYHEIGNEVYRELPEWREAIGLMNRLPPRAFTFDEWRSSFETSEELTLRYRAEDTLRTLFKFGVVGMKRGDRTLYKYRR